MQKGKLELFEILYFHKKYFKGKIIRGLPENR